MRKILDYSTPARLQQDRQADRCARLNLARDYAAALLGGTIIALVAYWIS